MTKPEKKWAIVIARPNDSVINLWSDKNDANKHASELNQRFQTEEYYVIEWDGVKPASDFQYKKIIGNED